MTDSTTNHTRTRWLGEGSSRGALAHGDAGSSPQLDRGQGDARLRLARRGGSAHRSRTALPRAAEGSASNLEVLVSGPATLTRAQSAGDDQAQAAVIGGLGAQMPVARIPRSRSKVG
jgi:hypothetical protein